MAAVTLEPLEKEFAPADTKGSEGELPPIEDAAELITKPIVLPPDVIEGIAHRGGKIVFGGASKSFKTWLLADLGISVATGSCWLGKFPTKRGRVLYMNFELPASFFAKRIATICDEHQITLEAGMLSLWNLRGHVADWARLRQQIPPGEFVLIILDPCYKLLLGRDENKAGDIASLMDEFEVLAVKTDAAVGFGAHYSKGNQSQKESIDRIGGSGVFARDPDTILNFTRHEEPYCFTVEATLRNHPPIDPFVVRWEYPLFCVDSTLDPANLKTPGRPKLSRAKELIDLIDRPLSATEIVGLASKLETPIPRRTVFELLGDLKRGGLLKQPENRGKYEPA
jgi:AAA domain-containing protein